MAKIKHTKTELKAQAESLKRFERFLPMLMLKKQQLQAEIAAIDTQLETKLDEERTRMTALSGWASLFSEPIDLDDLARLEQVNTDSGNIAGVAIPLFKGVDVTYAELDLFETPSWLDDAQDALGELIAIRAESAILEEQKLRIEKELRTTSQRVNLFEKVKIPECKENIRIIKIYLGDEQTAAVARGKMAKGLAARRAAAEAA